MNEKFITYSYGIPISFHSLEYPILINFILLIRGKNRGFQWGIFFHDKFNWWTSWPLRTYQYSSWCSTLIMARVMSGSIWAPVEKLPSSKLNFSTILIKKIVQHFSIVITICFNSGVKFYWINKFFLMCYWVVMLP